MLCRWECDHQSHCLTRHYFDPPPPPPQYMGNAMQAEAVLPKSDALIGCDPPECQGESLSAAVSDTPLRLPTHAKERPVHGVANQNPEIILPSWDRLADSPRHLLPGCKTTNDNHALP